MFVTDGNIVYSASDLAAAARCEYALLRNFDAKLGWGPVVDVEDELLARTAALGDDHERRELDRLRAEFADGVAVIGRPAYTLAGLTAAAEATRRAIANHAPVVYQAAMFDGRFVGFADFLVAEGEQYRLVDTKLARSPKVTALLQLAAYADALTGMGVAVADEAELRLGDGSVVRYRVCDLIPVFRSQRAQLQRLLDEHHAGGTAVRWEDEGVRACFRCALCVEQVRATDDLLLVAGMRISQRDRLIDAGITTVAELARHCGPVPDLAPGAVAKLTAQATIQVRQRDTGIAQFEVVDPQPLTLLPEPDPGDLFFDFEGDPLWTADGHDWGLEYLFGVLDAAGKFSPLWAHDRVGERRALIEFLAMVKKRRKRRPNMHIYHYAPYEKTALLRLAGRYGVGEDEVDDLLRSGTLVDLYPLVRKSIRSGAESFSLKALEPLYMGTLLRSGDVTTAADSITSYAKSCELRDNGRADEAETVLKEIEDYNLYDCRSTQQLRNWLLVRAWESGVTPVGAQPVSGGNTVGDHDELAATLAAFTGDAAVGDRTPEQIAVALVGAARGYHRREDKPFWWSHFDRLNFPVDEWADNTDVFIADPASVSVSVDWHTPPKARKPQRRVTLRGELARGDLMRDVFALYEAPAPPSMTDNPDRRAAGRATVVEVDDPAVPTEVVILERIGSDGNAFHQLPFALTPGPPLPTAALRESIESTAIAVAAGLPHLPRTAMIDVLLRSAPRTKSPLPRSTDTITDITAAALDLESSYLAVHGPPGTGKTYTAAAVITRLVTEHGWRVGVVAQSHATVENLLDAVIDAGLEPSRVAKKKYDRDCPRWQEIDGSEYGAFISAQAGCVIGGTAWDFANANRVLPGSLDLLAIDEAGQFCLANTIAVAPAARNLLLLGDPQQLPQVSQGTHPEPVDTSALDWLVDGQRTLPDERGYFLDLSYRMHPSVCAAVSELSYEGRLHSVTERTANRRLDGCTPGVRVISVHHQGNSNESPEEADVIVAEIGRLLGSPWTDEHGRRALTASDVLVLAPYNAQVSLVRQRLASAGLDGVRVGTVDKFQGGQAPVVFISMTASSVDEVPRGISFLLNRNRLNVAVSRAQYAAVIVRSELLTEYLPGTPAGLLELGGFLALTATG
ncbi:MAG: TM0106 family RecB-like putative nuclease [Actinomycetota bacterium]|uniref:TM0106 family RecB-like putative nuclease n=1 Tax=Mycobacterium lentiflavum TaxID=141349 RepID=A0ABY3UV18_MYCLN|nr:TM0106 family RecB-like putative nuclease [Mycobacterium lentiflavum]MEE3067499.1 TM0106 family RecB-like putative nuclease [Actinomycetota bacterium]ULP41263.1 TM0106 family RecB-like putative nuclease [Mycobacterium lentiflavum]